MVRVYVGGYDCCEEYVQEWMARGMTPDGVYETLEEARARCEWDLEYGPDDLFFFVLEDGSFASYWD